jgi:hypothetical protein
MSLQSKTDEELRLIAVPIMDNLMEGSTEIDWEKHTRDHTERVKKFITREELERQCKDYQSKFGFFTQRDFIGVTRHEDYVNVIWSQRMSKTPNEYTAILSLVEENGKVLVERCWVDLWEPNDSSKRLESLVVRTSESVKSSEHQ